MSAFTSMLVPVETLALVPLAALPDSPLNALVLFVGAPLVLGVIITIVTKLTARRHHGADVPNTDPTWVGSKAQHDEILGTDNAAGKAGRQGGPAPDAPTEGGPGGVRIGGVSVGDASGGASRSGTSAGGASAGEDKGGASARW